MISYSVSSAAETDLLEIWFFIANQSEAAADKLLREMHLKFELLSHQPHLGRPPSGTFSRPAIISDRSLHRILSASTRLRH